ncbi:hypothetical protein AQ505_19655 [Pedobacter sp. PACM 27299]|uniref:LiaF transmembrane domain-containing protein n=1 Tax=Pedobacter sp. PACM 27299 TaxID=1727164 RepID=UPI000706B6C9|nr:LiaF domain-containing protein [Pedobacter sp. PACM 27299]ALL07511.1 hypothetical protein AQ505_19655 [Pedobacter sp. PACM 27299]
MEKWNDGKKNNSIWAGLFLLVFGLVFLLKNIGLQLPGWLLSWHTILMVIGLLIGYKKNFQGGGWLAMFLVGAFFTLQRITDANMSKYFFAMAFIIMGLYLIFRPKPSRLNNPKWKKKQANFTDGAFANQSAAADSDDGLNTAAQGTEAEELDIEEPKTDQAGWVDENDVIAAVCVFGGTDSHVYSKNFKGGEMVAVFGGCNVNLTQADFEGAIVLEIVAVFGGVKIIIPSSWIVKSEVVAIFGGIEDKRGPVILSDGGTKIVKITGMALFGGVEIRNF